MTPEDVAAQKVRVRGSAWFMRLFRNNSGKLPNPKTNRWISFGLGNENKTLNKEYKSSDYIGFTPVIITQDMVGSKVAIITSIEVKKEGFKIKTNYSKKAREYAQLNWINMIINGGGIAGFASCASDVDKIMQEFHFRVRQNDNNK